MLFDKDKVELQIDLDGRTTYQPGQAVLGRLIVKVLKQVNVTAIRLLARGKEKTQFSVSEGDHNVSLSGSYIHYEQLISFFGFSKESGRTGGASLQVGSYEYPFQLVIPPNAPPSFRCRIPDGTTELSYILRATVDIPHGFDKEKELPFVVVPTMAQRQYDELLTMTKTTTNTVGLNGGSGCCGSHKNLGDAVVVTAEVPMVGPLLPFRSCEDTNCSFDGDVSSCADTCVSIRLTLRNMSLKTRIRRVRVKLQQYRLFKAEGRTNGSLVTISTAEVSPPSGELIPRAMATFEVTLQLPGQMQQAKKVRKSDPAPTITTPLLEVTNFLAISFPAMGAEAVATISDVMPIVAETDPTNAVPMVPCSYFHNNIYPEVKLGVA